MKVYTLKLVAGILVGVLTLAPTAEATSKKSRRHKSFNSGDSIYSTQHSFQMSVREQAPPPATRFSIQGQSGHWEYKEPGLMREYGMLYGARLTIETSAPSSPYLYIGELDFLRGDITYDGMYDNGEPVSSPTRDMIWAARGLMGFPSGVFVGGRPTSTPFFGIGYRSLNDVIEGRGGYERQITYLYLPFGVKFAGEMGPSTTISTGLEADLLLAGSVKSNLSDVSSDYPDITNNQEAGSGFGLQADVSFHYKTESFGVHFQPFVQYWKVETSQPVYVYSGTEVRKYVEPDNNSTLWGARIGIDL